MRNLTAQYPVISYAVISLEGLLKAELRGGVGFGLPWRLNSERHWVLPPDATLGGAVSVAKWGEALPEEQSR